MDVDAINVEQAVSKSTKQQFEKQHPFTFYFQTNHLKTRKNHQ